MTRIEAALRAAVAAAKEAAPEVAVTVVVSAEGKRQLASTILDAPAIAAELRLAQHCLKPRLAPEVVN